MVAWVKMGSAAQINHGQPAFQVGGVLQRFGVPASWRRVTLRNSSPCRAPRPQFITGTEMKSAIGLLFLPLSLTAFAVSAESFLETRYGADLRVGDRVKVIQNKIELNFS